MGRHLSNLPAEVTSFVGRRQELREVKRLLTTTRLLTLTGSGGAGKTKLALRAATEMSRGFRDGAWLVLLDSVRDPLLVTQAVFSALGVQDLSSGVSLSSLADYLADKRLLLVLDNCEHLLDGCAELAAVRLGSLSLEQLNRGLAGELSILGTGEPRCRSSPSDAGGDDRLELPACWTSRNSLLWARLSVFAGGFEEDAATEVCSDARIPAVRIAGLLGALVDKSILKRQLVGGPPRYWLLETMRQYGLERLREIGEQAAMQQRHLDWILGLAESIGALDNRQIALFDRMRREQDNLWAALDFCAQQPAGVAAASELAQYLHPYWTSRGPFGDVRRVLTSLAELAPADSVPRARLLWVAAVMALSVNDYDACAALSEESLRIGTAARDVEVVGWALTMLAVPRFRDGDLAGAKERVESALSLARLMRLDQVEMTGHNTLCPILIAAGEIDRAIEIGEREVARREERGEFWSRGYQLDFLSRSHWLRGDREKAERLAREAAVCKHAVDDRNGLTMVLETLASMAAERGRPERAAILLGTAQRVRDTSSLTLIELFREQHEQSVSNIIRGIGQKSFDAAYARGRAMTIDEGVAFAVEDKPARKPVTPVKFASDTELTPRQLEIARLIADDLTNRQIADRLFLSERTVETHITNMLNKLGLNSRVQLSRWIAELPETSQS